MEVIAPQLAKIGGQADGYGKGIPEFCPGIVRWLEKLCMRYSAMKNTDQVNPGESHN